MQASLSHALLCQCLPGDSSSSDVLMDLTADVEIGSCNGNLNPLFLTPLYMTHPPSQPLLAASFLPGQAPIYQSQMSYNWVTCWSSDTCVCKSFRLFGRENLRPWLKSGMPDRAGGSLGVFVYSAWSRRSLMEDFAKTYVCGPWRVSRIHPSVPFPGAGRSFVLSLV